MLKKLSLFFLYVHSILCLIKYVTNFELAIILKERRQARGLTQSELAAQSGVSLPLIQIIEAQRGNPTLEVLGKILKALGLTLSIFSPPANWGYLIQFGLPLTNEGAETKKRQRWDVDKFSENFKAAISEAYEDGPGNARKRDALVGMLLAISEYYPKKTEAMGLGPLARKYKSAEGRHIKLKRIALAELQKYL